MWLRLHPERDALFLDIDGTLLDIARTARDVVVDPSLIEDLVRVQEKMGGALALLSGRSIEDIDRLFSPFRAVCAGAHGGQWRLAPTGECSGTEPLSEALRAEIAVSFSDLDGVRIEDKTISVAVHYRQAPEVGAALRDRLSRLVAAQAEPLALIPGRKVVEIARSRFDKGGALEKIMKVAPFKGRRPVFLGDDVTDLSAIGAALKLGGVAARVGRDTPRRNAFPAPEKVREWLGSLLADPD